MTRGSVPEASTSCSWSCPPKTSNLAARSSMKNIVKMVIRAMPSAQSYSVIGPDKHGDVNASTAGASNCES